MDVAIHVGQLADSSLVAHRFASTRWIICAAPGYLAGRGTPRGPADLAQHECLNFIPSMAASVWTVKEPAGASRRIKISSTIVTNQGQMLLELARAGVGIVRLAEFHVVGDLIAGGWWNYSRTSKAWEEVPSTPCTKANGISVRAFVCFWTSSMHLLRTIPRRGEPPLRLRGLGARAVVDRRYEAVLWNRDHAASGKIRGRYPIKRGISPGLGSRRAPIPWRADCRRARRCADRVRPGYDHFGMASRRWGRRHGRRGLACRLGRARPGPMPALPALLTGPAPCLPMCGISAWARTTAILATIRSAPSWCLRC